MDEERSTQIGDNAGFIRSGQHADRDLIATIFFWFTSTVFLAASIAPISGDSITGTLLLFVLSIYALALGIRYVANNSFLSQLAAVVLLTGLAVAVSLLSIPRRGELRAALDLYLVFLLSISAFFHCWRWQLQLAAAVAIFAATLVSCLFAGGSLPWSTMLLIVTTGVLSALACKVMDERQAAPALQTEPRQQLFHSTGWHVFLLQAGLLFVLLIVDLGFGGQDRTFAVVAKLYGVLVVILGALLAASAPQRGLAFSAALTTFFLSIVLSLTRLQSDFIVEPALSSLPLIFLAFVSLLVPLSLAGNLLLMSAMVVGDLLIKSLTLYVGQLALIDALGQSVSAYRWELMILVSGIIAAAALRIFVVRYLEQRLQDFMRASRTSLLSAESGRNPRRFQRAIGPLAAPAESRQLLFGLFCLGLISNVVTTKLLMQQYVGAAAPVVLSWIFFLGSWFGLVFQQMRQPAWRPIWHWGAALCFLSLLWPTLLLLATNAGSWLWLFWPIGVVVGIGFIPWSASHVVPLLVLIVAIGAEVVVTSNYQTPGWCILAASIFVGLLLSKQNIRRLRDRVFFDHFSDSLSAAGSPAQVLRTLADYLLELFDAQMALVLTPEGDCELIVEDEILPFSDGAESFREIVGGLAEVMRSAGNLRLKLIRDIPSSLRTIRSSSGVVQMRHGLIVEISTDDAIGGRDAADGSTSRHSNYLVAILTPWPIYDLVQNQELSIAGFLAAVSRLRIIGFENDAEQLQQRRKAETQLQQREFELSTLVHDINNTVQDLTLLCEAIADSLPQLMEATVREPKAETDFLHNVQKIALIARSVATVVSDAKRSRELEKFQDLTPREVVPVSALVEDIAGFASIRAERKRITVDYKLLAEEEVFAMVSMREHLETILRNLLNNSIFYSEPGSHVEIRVRATAEKVFIEIADSGRGLSPEECETIFLPGVRGKSSAQTGGLGIGLSESRRFAEAAGGSLTATSGGPGQGSIFTVELPRREKPVGSGTSMWALLVDDQPALTDFYAKIARAHHLQSEIAGSVGEALEKVKLRGRPGLVITDIHLGNGDGLDLVRKLREEFGNALPIVVISGINGEEALQRVRAAGATDFVAKPVGQRALFARIQSLLS